MKNRNMQHNNHIVVLINILIPGKFYRWLPVSFTIRDLGNIYNKFEFDADYIKMIASEIAALPVDRREEALAAREAADGAAFQRMLAALYRLYYTSPSVLAAVADLADAGPREPSPHVDPTLVAQVLARKAGQRRLGP